MKSTRFNAANIDAPAEFQRGTAILVVVALISLTDLFDAGPVAVLTGAGVSTDSGIPDYRGAGTPPRTPMSIHQFTEDENYRRRFWAGARVGAFRGTKARPNAGHRVLAQLEQAGLTTGVITQNVDNLHFEAGSKRVTELHGNGATIRCVVCRSTQQRSQVLQQFDDLNPNYATTHQHAKIAPDGDAIVTDFETLTVPPCPVCGGMLRPDVIYFGETVPQHVFAEAEKQVLEAAALMCVGTSLAVNTGVRLVHRAQRAGLPIAVINRGATAADHRAALRISGGTTEVLESLWARLSKRSESTA